MRQCKGRRALWLRDVGRHECPAHGSDVAAAGQLHGPRFEVHGEDDAIANGGQLGRGEDAEDPGLRALEMDDLGHRRRGSLVFLRDTDAQIAELVAISELVCGTVGRIGDLLRPFLTERAPRPLRREPVEDGCRGRAARSVEPEAGAPDEQRDAEPSEGGRGRALRQIAGTRLAVASQAIGGDRLPRPRDQEDDAGKERNEVRARLGEAGRQPGDEDDADDLGDEEDGADSSAAEGDVAQAPCEDRAAEDPPRIGPAHPPMSRVRSSSSPPAEVTARSLSPARSRVSERGGCARSSRMRTAIELPSGSERSRSSRPTTGESASSCASTIWTSPPPSSARWRRSWMGISCSMTPRIERVGLTVSSIDSWRKSFSFFGALTRAIERGTLKRIFATWQAARFTASSPVTAATTSARPMPASAWYRPSQPSLAMTMLPSSSAIWRARAGSSSMTTTSCPAARSSLVR